MLQVVGRAIYAIVVLDGYIRGILVFKTQQSIDELRTGFSALAIPHPLYGNYNRHQFQHMQFNTNGIGNKLTELGEFLKRHNVKVDVIQESKLSSDSKIPSIQNITTVRKDRGQGQGGGLLTLIHKSINFSRKPDSPATLVEPHLEELTITATLGYAELIITNVYIPRQAPAQEVTSRHWII